MRGLVLSLMVALLATPALAASIIVTEPFSRPARQSVGTGAAYMVLGNPSDTDVALIGAATPIAGHVEIHEIVMDPATNAMKMQEIQQLAIPAGGSVTLKPGGFHLMLMHLQQNLNDGESFPLTLRFNNGTEQTITVPVRMPR